MTAPLLLAALIVASAVDGDTIRVGSETVRIANIDTPEIHTAKCDAERRLGQLAKSRVEALLRQGEVVVHPGDPKSGRTRDRHGRLLALVTIAGRDLGATLIAEGYARPWRGRREPWCD